MTSGDAHAPDGADVDPELPTGTAGEEELDDEAGEMPGAESAGGKGGIPPADFTTLVTMFSTQAMVALGFIPHPASGKPEPNIDLAKHFIDLLGVVEQKTRGNLESREQKLLDATLHDLRMAFVQMLRRPSK